MNNIAIVTDSTSDLTLQTAAEQGVTMVPLSVIHQDKTYRDGVDITPKTFYQMLEGASQLPTTSQPSPAEFEKAYEQALTSAKEVVSIHISGGLSATSSSARIAAENVDKEHIHVIDSGFVTYALALQVLEAAKIAKQGATVAEVLSSMSRLREKMEFVFTLNTLHYLQKGGRIGKVSALMGTILGIKPVIRIAEGRLEPVGKARSMKLALQSVVDILAKRYGQEKVVVAVGHGAGAEYAAVALEMTLSALNVEGKPHLFEIGPVVGVHAGPGSVGVVVMPVEY